MKRILVMLAAIVAADCRESFNTSPPPIRSFFSCSGRPMGYYADLETNCRAYHTCDDHGNHFTHYCPEDTAFRQDAMICDHAYLVDCHANAAKGLPIKFNQDGNHDAPPTSFVEPHGEGTSARGFARSFRINPEAKNDTASTKYPTFVLNSSVFLNGRETTSKRPTTRFGDTQRTKSTHQDDGKNYQTPSGFRSSVNPSRNLIVTTPRPQISEELLPPLESYRTSNDYQNEDNNNNNNFNNNNFNKNNFNSNNNNNYNSDNDEYSFLIPPPVRDDNYYYAQQQQQQSSFESLKSTVDSSHKSTQSTFRIVTLDNNNNKNNFQKPKEPSNPSTSTISPHTQAILEMAKARALGREFSPARPVNYLEPPRAKPDYQRFSSNDPYKDTLLALQDLSRAASTVSTASPLTTTTTRVPPSTTTEASIFFGVPTRTLQPSNDNDSDPYYPRSSTTEAYYTPRYRDGSRKPIFSTTTTRRTMTSKFEIPAQLPDLNSLEDLLDRRKFFFIPQNTKSA